MDDGTLDRCGSFCTLRWQLFVLQGMHHSAINIVLGQALGQWIEFEENAHGQHA